VSRIAGAHFFIGRVRRDAGRVADGGAVDAGQLPELAFGAPEAAQAEERQLRAGGEWRDDAVAVHEVLFGDRQRRGAAREDVSGVWQDGLLAERVHTHLGVAEPRYVASVWRSGIDAARRGQNKPALSARWARSR
jgi:hypothetical protein